MTLKKKIFEEKDIDSPKIIFNFPGVGFTSTIVGEYIVNHSKHELLLSAWLEDDKLALGIHDGELNHPISLYYVKKYNLLLLHSLVNPIKYIKEFLGLIEEIYDNYNASEIISVDGIIGKKSKDEIFYYSNHNRKFKNKNVKKINNGVLLGFSSHLLLKDMKATGLYSITSLKSSDVYSSLKVLNLFNDEFNMNIDQSELNAKAKKFENKLKKMHLQKKVNELKNKKKQDYNYIG
ncbi:MAG: PAC2 family protein [Candidatus Woesearchaeota archaeon]